MFHRVISRWSSSLQEGETTRNTRGHGLLDLKLVHNLRRNTCSNYYTLQPVGR